MSPVNARRGGGAAAIGRRAFNVALLAILGGGLSACGGSGDGPSILSVDAQGVSSIDVVALAAVLSTCPVETLTQAEADSLAYMREEEQLAHDVYAVSATLYAQPIFANITESAATHSAAIKLLLDHYRLADPLAGLPNGTFPTPEFQNLYDALVATSAIGLIEALQVGVEIEELDIRDITAQMAIVDNANILMVYEHLVRASRNHLRAFMKVLTQAGGTYVPKYISQVEFDAIVNSPMETGR